MPPFGRHSTEASPPRHYTDNYRSSDEHRHSKLFGRRRSSRSSSSSSSGYRGHHSGTNGTRHGILHRQPDDHSITAARERVVSAEAAERDADRALMACRSAVREARDHVKRLEHEAKEQSRMAKNKQKQAKSISKRAKPLGRFS